MREDLAFTQALAEELSIVLPAEQLKQVKGVAAFAATTAVEGVMVACCKTGKNALPRKDAKAGLDMAWSSLTKHSKICDRDVQSMLHPLVVSRAMETTMSLQEQ